MAELLQQVRVLDPNSQTDRIADVLLDTHRNRILAIETQLEPEPDTTITPATGCILAPGLVDFYSHSGEPGYEDRETLRSLTAAAGAGGFTRLAILPDTEPMIDHGAMVQSLSQTVNTSGCCAGNWQFWGALTHGCQGQQMAEYGDLQAQVVGFTDGRAIADWTLLQRSLIYLQPLGKPIALVPALTPLQQQGVARESPTALALGLPMDPACSETAAIAALLELVATTATPVHLMKISTARGVALIAAAKAQGLPITASTTWLHLLWEVQDLHRYDPSLHLAPPLGTPDDRQALIAGVRTGVIDAIAIDHTPYTYEEKTVSFATSPVGAIGLELALPLLWEKLVKPGLLSPLELWQALSHRPAQCLGQASGRCAVDAELELVLFDPAVAWRVEPGELRSLSCNTHLLNQTIHGRVQRTFYPASSNDQ
ncbi:MAG: dihydroorotase [Cyanobacteria bacterium P01_G01_bin.54]